MCLFMLRWLFKIFSRYFWRGKKIFDGLTLLENIRPQSSIFTVRVKVDLEVLTSVTHFAADLPSIVSTSISKLVEATWFVELIKSQPFGSFLDTSPLQSNFSLKGPKKNSKIIEKVVLTINQSIYISYYQLFISYVCNLLNLLDKCMTNCPNHQNTEWLKKFILLTEL